MIPLEAIFGSLQLLISIFLVFKLKKSHQKKPKSINLRYFFYTFVLLSIAFAVSALSWSSVNIFKFDFFISSINIIGRGLILLAIMFFAYIPLNILEEDFWINLIPLSVLITASISNLFSLMSLFNYPITPIGKVGAFSIRLHRADTYTNLGLISIGIMAVLILSLATYKYWRVVKLESEDPYLKKRGFLILTAAVMFLGGVISNYFISLSKPLVGRVGSEVFYLVGLIIFLISVLYKKKN